jgi:hypothetical protein
VVTHDSFIHVLGGPEEAGELLVAFNLKDASVKEMTRMEEPLVEITEAKPPGLFNFLYSSKKVLFRFDDDESKKEWMPYFKTS